METARADGMPYLEWWKGSWYLAGAMDEALE